MMPPKSGDRCWFKYFLLAVLAWLIVDFTTTEAIGNPHGYYSKYMPALLVFYLGYPLVFAVLRYKLLLGPKGLFAAMLAAIPISLAHYGMVTFLPMWLTEGTLSRNKKWAVATITVFAAGVILNILTQYGSHPQ